MRSSVGPAGLFDRISAYPAHLIAALSERLRWTTFAWRWDRHIVQAFELGRLVGFAHSDLGSEGLLAGEPGTVIDENGPDEITVSFEHGPSISVPASDLETLMPAEWTRRRERMRHGLHPTDDRRIP
jgi:hypothetical protein